MSLQWFSETTNQIVKNASALSVKECHQEVTLTHLLAALLANKEILSLLSILEVAVDALTADVLKELDTLDKIDGAVSAPQNTETVKQLYMLARREYEERLSYVKSNKMADEKANIDPLVLFTLLVVPDRIQPDKEYHLVQKLIEKHSAKPSLIEFIETLNGVVSDHTREHFGVAREHYLPDLSTEMVGETAEQDESVSFLERFTVDMNKAYRNGEIEGVVVGREKVVNSIVQSLCRKKKSNPLLIGYSGVGKTSVVDHLAALIVDGNVPKSLGEATIYSLNVARLVAGTKYRGDFELRMDGVIKELKEAPHAILFIDELHTVMGAGGASSGSMDVANLLKQDLAAGAIRMIGTTTHDDYRQHLAKDEAFSRRLQPIYVDEPSIADMPHVVKNSIATYVAHHGVEYSEEAMMAAIKLSDRYLHNLHFPDKAFDVLDQAGSFYSSGLKKGSTVTEDDVIEVVAQKANVKIATHKKEKNQLRSLPNSLKRSIYGQDEAIAQITKSIYLSKSDLQDSSKPTACFLFTGPTGVGKTEVVKTCAKEMHMTLHRFDMSEYMQEHSVNNLIGSPLGFHGSDKGGVLTEALKREPYSIVLLDEVEKAHPKVFDLLLQVADNGFLRDGQGVKVSFRNAIIVMTSNIGIDKMNKGSMGFTEETVKAELDVDVLKKFFRTEFLNRLTGVVVFNFLSESTVVQVVKKNIEILKDKLAEQDIQLSLTSGAVKWLALHGYDRKMGARPMDRIISKEVKEPLSESILFGDLQNGGKVKCSVVKEKLVLTIN
jgi:ATP-dependent Clp protease ATP-binding subunit ClpA